MFFAAKEGHLEVTKLLIKAGADVTLTDKVQHCKCTQCNALLYISNTVYAKHVNPLFTEQCYCSESS